MRRAGNEDRQGEPAALSGTEGADRPSLVARGDEAQLAKQRNIGRVRQRRGVGFAGTRRRVWERHVLLQKAYAQPASAEHRSLRRFETTGKYGEQGGFAGAIGTRHEQPLRGGDVQPVETEPAGDYHIPQGQGETFCSSIGREFRGEAQGGRGL